MLTIDRFVKRRSLGLSRRRLLQAGGTGLFGLNVPRLLQAEDTLEGAFGGKARSVIFLFLFGGPSQLETFDMKPEAADTVRGPFQPIASRTPGLKICEHLPGIAAVSDRLSIIRTMSHGYNDHSGGGHYIQTGHRWQVPVGGGFNVTPDDWPSMGSVIEYMDQKRGNISRDLPSYMVVPNFLGRLQEYSVQLRRPGETAGWLGRRFDPLNTRINKRNAKDNPYFRDCVDSELTFQIAGLAEHESLTPSRLERRRTLLDQFDSSLEGISGSGPDAYGQFQKKAIGLVSSARTREALDIRREDAGLRDRYGRNLFGQSTLMARRLVEAGTRFVTVHFDAVDGYSWDSHRNSADVEKHLLPALDKALSTLIVDLEDRGLLDETLVVCLGEMGRTPKANSTWGRNHWSTLFPAVLAGAGVQGGQLIGETDKQAAYATTPPYSPEDLAATVYRAMGISPELRLPDQQGRPVHIVDGGRPIDELFG